MKQYVSIRSKQAITHGTVGPKQVIPASQKRGCFISGLLLDIDVCRLPGTKPALIQWVVFVGNVHYTGSPLNGSLVHFST